MIGCGSGDDVGGRGLKLGCDVVWDVLLADELGAQAATDMFHREHHLLLLRGRRDNGGSRSHARSLGLGSVYGQVIARGDYVVVEGDKVVSTRRQADFLGRSGIGSKSPAAEHTFHFAFQRAALIGANGVVSIGVRHRAARLHGWLALHADFSLAVAKVYGLRFYLRCACGS